MDTYQTIGASIILLAIIIALLIPKYKKGIIVFDIDNTILCNGSLLGNDKCNHYPTAESPCSVTETIHPWSSPQVAYGQPYYDGMCRKDQLKDGQDITCAIHAYNSLPPTNCDPTIDPVTGFPKGTDCLLAERIQSVIKMARDKGYYVAINTARTYDAVVPIFPYLKNLGFYDSELQDFQKGGMITYNTNSTIGFTDLYTTAKQKAINMISLSNRFNMPRNRMVLLDDQLVNCKAVRDEGFKAYNVSTTYGQQYGWSCDSLTVGQERDPFCQCGITDGQINEIFNLLN